IGDGGANFSFLDAVLNELDGVADGLQFLLGDVLAFHAAGLLPRLENCHPKFIVTKRKGRKCSRRLWAIDSEGEKNCGNKRLLMRVIVYLSEKARPKFMRSVAQWKLVKPKNGKAKAAP